MMPSSAELVKHRGIVTIKIKKKKRKIREEPTTRRKEFVVSSSDLSWTLTILDDLENGLLTKKTMAFSYKAESDCLRQTESN